MPRSSRTCELEFDLKIEKTARRLQKETKQLKGETSTSSNSKSDFDLDMPTFNESEEVVMVQNTERMINDMTSLDLNQQPFCIEYPTLDVDFELKSGLIHLLPIFRGLAGEDPHKHLKEFRVAIKQKTDSTPCLQDPLLVGTSSRKYFLKITSPLHEQQTSKRKSVEYANFLVKASMGIGGYLKQLVESCPHHQISDLLLIQYFYEGLSEVNRSLVDTASGVALYDKTPIEARKLITTMATNNQQFGSRNDNPPRKINELRTSIDERLDKLSSLEERFIVGNTQQVKAYGICTSSGHATDACPTLQEEPTMRANVVGGFSGPSERGHDLFSNTYNPGWRDHPNLSYGNQPQNFQRPPHQQPPPPQTNSNSGTSLEDMMKTLVANTQQFQQDTRASIQNLESQMSQLASSISRLESQGKLPFQTIINPKQRLVLLPCAVKKKIQFENNTRRGNAQQDKIEDSIERRHAEQAKTGEKLEISPKQAEKLNLTHEEHPKVFVTNLLFRRDCQV
ncbi:UNVERIFIED_CONTAM: hypothetical protein Scaly_2830200 [Sesamum calycinum]|uniref:Retrotransposon gag protein n=1 Tax=Sesamum calycinum TaxID=2727403 RepID=A0AAW2ISJ3_9LAMI